MPPRIEFEVALDLPLDGSSSMLLEKLFAHSQQVIVKQEFTGNFSGSRVLWVQLVTGNSAPLPVVVKLASTSLIEKEWRAYNSISHMLYGMVQIQSHALSGESDWGALCYPLHGGGIFAVESLHNYYKQQTSDAVIFALQRLFRTLETIHNQSQAHPGFSWHSSYDHILPLNLLIEVASPPPHTSVSSVNVENLHAKTLQPGDWVRLENFVVTKVDLRRQTISLNLPRQKKHSLSFCARAKSTGALPTYREGQVIPVLEGQILTTRQSQLESYAHTLLENQVASFRDNKACAEGMCLPNPFSKIHPLLHQYRNVRTALIHGDLNLRNVLVDAETGSVSLIDIAEARVDHILHDFFRLETEIVTHLLSAALYDQHRSPCQTMVELYQHLHCATFEEGYLDPAVLPATLQKPFVAIQAIRHAAKRHFYSRESSEYYQGLLLYLVGALKFANLDKHPAAPLPKQAAFWAAAAIAQLLETEQACAPLPVPEKARQAPHALLIAHSPDVKVLREGAACFSPAMYGLPLYLNDVVSTFVNGEATVHCAQGALFKISAERNQLIDCHHIPPERVSARLDLHYTAPLSSLVNDFSVNFKLCPETASTMSLAPRNTYIAENRPTFHWHPLAGAKSYRLSMRMPTGQVWQREVTGTTLSYPDTVSPLEPGSGNTIILEALGVLSTPDIAYLQILDSKAMKKIQNAKALIQTLALDPVAKTYLYAQLYQSSGMWQAAIEQLEKLPKMSELISPIVWLQLGELHLRVGNYHQAERKYEKARQSSETTSDDPMWATAHLGLACAHYAQNHLKLAQKTLTSLDGSAYAKVAKYIRKHFENSSHRLPQYSGAMNVFAYARFLAQHIAAHLADQIRQIPDYFLEQLQLLSTYPLKPASTLSTLGPDKFTSWETLAATYLTTQKLVNTLSRVKFEELHQKAQLTPYLEKQARDIAQQTLGLSAAQAKIFASRYAALISADSDSLLRLFTHKEP